MSETPFGSWGVAESPIQIEYSLVVIEEIRRHVANGFQRLSRGGLEVGGVLYGVRDGRTVRVLATREIACEHARGPAFLLSDKDRAELGAQLSANEQDPHLSGMICVGWFLSHTRSEILLSESDQEIYAHFFPAPWQVTMVIHPGRGGSMRAGFFVREPDGSVRSDQSYLNFNFPERTFVPSPRYTNPPEPRSVERRPTLDKLDETPVEPPASREMPAMMAALPEVPRPLREQQPRSKWPWLIAWAIVVCGGAAFGVRYFKPARGPEPLDLSILEQSGQLHISWNRSVAAIASAAKGTLQILDGTQEIVNELSAQDLRTGSFTYQRKTGDVQVRLTVQASGGAKIEEASRFLGRAPVAPQDSGELTAWKQQRADLEAQIAHLKSQNGQQADRIQTLERTLRILQSR